MQGKLDTAMLPRDELRKLFELRKCASDTHDSVECARCPKKADGLVDPADAPPGAFLTLVGAPASPLHPRLFFCTVHLTFTCDADGAAPSKPPPQRIGGFKAPRRVAAPTPTETGMHPSFYH